MNLQDVHQRKWQDYEPPCLQEALLRVQPVSQPAAEFLQPTQKWIIITFQSSDRQVFISLHSLLHLSIFKYEVLCNTATKSQKMQEASVQLSY
jgi:hypothetical protein